MGKFKNKISRLVLVAEYRGYITHEDIQIVFPETEHSTKKINKVVEALDDQGVEVLENPPENEEHQEHFLLTSNEPDRMEADPFQYYLSQMSHIPLLTREEEVNLASTLADARESLRKATLSTKLALTEAVKILEKVLSGELVYEKTLTFRSNKKVKKKKVLKWIRDALEKFKKVIRQNIQDYDKIQLGDFSRKKREKILQKMKDRQKESIELLEKFHIKLPQVLYWKKKLQEVADNVDSLRENLEGASEEEKTEIEKKIQYNLGKIWESEEDLRKRLDFINTEFKRYKEAKDKLSQGNLRLVISIAKKYRNKGLPFMDLIQEGNSGLMRAVEKFDHTLGFKFSTYATWWIRQSVTRAIAEKSRLVRIPIYMSDILLKIKYVTARFIQENGRTPELEELAEEVDVDPEDLERMFRLNRNPLSIYTPVGTEEDDGYIGDFLADDSTSPLATLNNYDRLKEKLADLLDTLSDKESEVLRLRFGLDNQRIHTLEELGQKFDVTRERIRQIEIRALRKLKHPAHDQHLEGLLDVRQ